MLSCIKAFYVLFGENSFLSFVQMFTIFFMAHPAGADRKYINILCNVQLDSLPSLSNLFSLYKPHVPCPWYFFHLVSLFILTIIYSEGRSGLRWFRKSLCMETGEVDTGGGSNSVLYKATGGSFHSSPQPTGTGSEVLEEEGTAQSHSSDHCNI